MAAVTRSAVSQSESMRKASAKKLSEAFDEEVVKEVADFERIKAVEFRETLGGLADAHVEFYGEVIDLWEKYVKEMEDGEGGSRGVVV